MFEIEVAALNLSDVGAIGIAAVLVVSFLSNTALRKSVEVTQIDLFIFLFVGWCVSIYLVYFEKADIKQLARLTLPLVTYVVAKNILRDSASYLRVLGAGICGYVVPVVISAGMTAAGLGIESVNYWTGEPRYKGVYSGAHSMAHAFELLLIIMVVYASTRTWNADPNARRLGALKVGAMLSLAALAAYCLAMSRVRSAILGALIFGVLYLWVFNRRWLFLGVVIGVAVALLLWPILFPFLFPDLVMIEKGYGDAMEIGSGRPQIWLNNWNVYLALPIDEQLAGVGIGSNRGSVTQEGIRDSHNDYIDILVQTGAVGLFLFLGLHIVLLRAVLRMPSRQKYVFLAAFLAVSITNVLSNSFLARFGLNQMYWLLMSYVEVSIRRKSPAATVKRETHVANSSL